MFLLGSVSLSKLEITRVSRSHENHDAMNILRHGKTLDERNVKRHNGGKLRKTGFRMQIKSHYPQKQPQNIVFENQQHDVCDFQGNRSIGSIEMATVFSREEK